MTPFDLEVILTEAQAEQAAYDVALARYDKAKDATLEALKEHPMVGHVLQYEETSYGSKNTKRRRFLVETVSLWGGYNQRRALPGFLAEGHSIVADGTKGSRRIERRIDQCTDGGLWPQWKGAVNAR